MAVTEVKGLTSADAAAARAAGHDNRATTATSRALSEILRANLLTRFNLLLGSLGVVILVVGPWRDAMFLGVVVANAAIGIVQEWRASRTLDRLRLLTAPTVTVWRDGEAVPLATDELVLGDVLTVGRGDQLPVDGEVLEADAFELDTSLLTGEAEPAVVRVGDEVRAGTIVVAGTGTLRATAVGEQRLASRIEAEARRFDLAPSDLRATTDRLLGIITWAIAVLGPVLVIRQAFGPESWRESTRGAVAGMVAMVPEGLVLLTSATLALGAIRLGRRRVLTQELAAIELLARVDVLCLDKTGTITTGQPSVVDVVATGPLGVADLEAPLAALARADPNPNLTLAAIRAAHDTDPGWATTSVVPFSSQRRWGGAVFADHGAWVLGAPDVLAPDAEPVAAAAEGNRVVALARVSGSLDPARIPEAEVVGLVVLAEQVRPTAPDTLAYLDAQGVTMKVISGDLPDTVGRVVAAAGRADPRVADGRHLPTEPDDLRALLDAHDVLGRVEPHGKKLLVSALRSGGHTVGMTGDGVNDVLALKEADLALAMGSGAPAARAVSELVLLDDDFDVVPDIVDEGRRVLANVERVSVFFLTKTIWACLLATVVAVSGMPYPLYASQATLIGFLTIGTPAFLLSFRRAAPRARPGIFDRIVRQAIPAGLVAAVAASITFTAVRYGLDHSVPSARSMTTVTLVIVSGVVVALHLGPSPGWWRLLPGAIGVTGAGIVGTEPLRGWFSLEDPQASEVLVAVASGFAAGVVLVGLVVWRRRRSSS